MTHIFIKLVLLKFLIIYIKCQVPPTLNKTHITLPHSSLEIPTGKCNQMEKNITLKLSNTELQKINNEFMDSPNINCLNLEGNRISRLSPEAFKCLPNLYFLNLARNLIPTSNLLCFNGHLKLKTLILDENMSNKKESNLTIKSYFPNLENLYLRKNGIWNMGPDLKQNLPNLTHLYLTENSIDNIEFFPSTLTHLYLEQNLIKRFNATMTKNIKVLFLDDNKIEVICNTYCREFSLSLNSVINLEYLSISGNSVIDVEPDSFDDTFNLTSLDLSKNKIDTIRKGSFNSLTKLQNLSMNNNILKTFPDLSALTNLRRLNLSNNLLETVPAGEFKNLFMLKILALSNNVLKNVEVESFGSLMSLEELDLSNNKLNRLPINWLTASENLRILNLRGNCFTNFRSLSLGNMESLQVIFLQKNPVKYLNTGTMVNLPKNVSIYLENEYRAECLRVVEPTGLNNGSVITKGLSSNGTPSVERID